ncbi:MAG: extracellular solute-binding protein [Planctomycetota bacterium]|nr:extracellular solute-binding protein [Planctomycetota bacterium]
MKWGASIDAARILFQRLLFGFAILAIAWAFLHVVQRELLGRDLEEDAVVLRVMHWSGGGGKQEDAIVADSIDAFMAEYPGTRVIRINPGDPGQFYTKLQTMMAAGDPPDLFYMNFERLPVFVDADQLMELDPLIRDDSGFGLDDFFPSTVEAFRWNGRRMGDGPLYGIPKDFTTLGFYYNADLFRTAGLPEPESDWTWDDFIESARAIGELPGRTGAEFITWPFVLRGYLRTAGVELRGETWDEVDLDDPRLAEALDRLRGWRFDEEHTLARGEAEGFDPASVFIDGNLGMIGPLGRWVVPQFRTIEETAEDGFEWNFAPMPRGRERANATVTVAWAMARESRHPEEAWNLLRYLTGADAQARLSRLGLAIPTRRSVAESDAFIDSTRPPTRDTDYLDAAEDAPVVDWPADPRFEAEFGKQVDLALRTGEPLDERLTAFGTWWQRARAQAGSEASAAPMPWNWIGLVGGVLVLLLAVAIAMLLRRGRLTTAQRHEERSGFLLASPWLIGFCLLLAFPIILSLLLSLTNWNGNTPLAEAEFIGFDNYREIVGGDTTFWTSLRVTAIYALLAVPTGQVFALLAALLLNTKVRGMSIFRAAWYLPSVLAGVGIALLWQLVFRGDGGLLNTVLEWTGVGGVDWLDGDARTWGPPAFAIMNLWVIGGSMMIYLAGLQGIPRSLMEAAEIDRVGPVTRFVRITLPMLSPVILFNLVMAVIASFQVFTQAFVMTGGGPGDHTRFYVLYIFNQAFDFYRMGYASALAWLLLVIVLVLTVIVLKTSGRYVYYEGMKQ